MEIRKDVQKFAELMEAILRQHDKEKGDSYKRMSREELKELFWKEVKEAIEGNRDTEFVDIVNFCMMIVNTKVEPLARTYRVLRNQGFLASNKFGDDKMKKEPLKFEDWNNWYKLITLELVEKQVDFEFPSEDSKEVDVINNVINKKILSAVEWLKERRIRWAKEHFECAYPSEKRVIIFDEDDFDKAFQDVMK